MSYYELICTVEVILALRQKVSSQVILICALGGTAKQQEEKGIVVPDWLL